MVLFGRGVRVALQIVVSVVVAGLACVGCHHNGSSGTGAGVNVATVGSGFAVGDDIEVRISIGALSGDAKDSLSGFDLDVLFDDTVLALAFASFVDPDSGINQLDLPEAGKLPFDGSAVVSGAGVVDAFGVSGNQAAVLDADQVNDFVFLVVVFTAIAPASSTSVSLDMGDANMLFLDSGSDATMQTFPKPAVSFGVAAR